MIIFTNSLSYFLITIIIFYLLRKKLNNPFIIDVILSIFWPFILWILIIYYIFKFIDKLAKST